MTQKLEQLHLRLRRTRDVDPARGAQEAWKAITIANELFGPTGWSRETLEMRCAATRERDGQITTAYVAKIRIEACLEGHKCHREAHGCGEGRGLTPFEAHDRGLKAAELDATLRALASSGKALGLAGFAPGTPKPSSKKAGRGAATSPASDNGPGAKIAPATPGEAPRGPHASGHNVSLSPKERPTARNGTAEASGDGLMVPKLKRTRSPAHLAYVRRQPCLVCGRRPVGAHHLRFAQPKAMSRKVSDEFTVPLCRRHHDLLHRDPDEEQWWASIGIDALLAARALWIESGAPASSHTQSDGAREGPRPSVT